MKRPSMLVTLAVAIAVSAAARAQSTGSSGTTIVHGRVVADDTGDPLRNARVVVAAAAEARPVLTDGEGRFAIAAPPAARTVTASKSGYASGGVSIAGEVEIRLPRGGVITGRIADERGEPLPMITVAADRLVRAGGRVDGRRAASADTDDRGEYRLFGLAAADYAVSIAGVRVVNAGGGIVSQLRMPGYYPGVPTLAQAQPIHVAAGDEVGGIDLTLKTVPEPPRNASGIVVAPSGDAMKATLRPSDVAPPGTIHGRVTGADGLPLPRARVQLASSDRLFTPDSRQVDDDGWYAFSNLAPGGYLLSVLMPGYRAMTFGQRTPWERGELVTMTASRDAVHVDLALRRGDAIAGRVVDEYGDPVENAAVTASVIRVLKGRRQLVGAPRAALRASGRSDDRGRYRIYGLAAGEYVVAATVGQHDRDAPTIDLPGYTRSYYPATLVPAEAAAVDVRDGEDRVNVDITLVKGATARVTGRVIGSGEKPATATVSLSPSHRSGALETGVRSIKADGTFEFDDVAPGEYIVQAGTTRSTVSSEGGFAALFVTVNDLDVTDLTLPMSAGSTLSGRIVFEDGDPPSATDGLELSPLSSDPDFASLAGDPVARADMHEDWTFEMSGISGPRRLRVVHAPGGWMLKTILVNGIDMTDQPLSFGTAEESLTDVVVVMTSRVTEVGGIVVDEHAAPFADAAAVVFACDRELWYAGSRFVVSADAGRGATFSLRGLAPADYYVAAVEKRRFVDVSEEIENREFLESLAANAARVTLEEGQRATVTIRVAR